MDGRKVDDAILQKSGNPSEHGQGKETCVYLLNAKLWDYTCSDQNYFVCKVSKKFEKCM
jgi:hypothetical protein